MSFDPVAFFAEHAARHLACGPHESDWDMVGAVFNRTYPYGMPMGEFAAKTLAQARRAQPVHRKRMLLELARYEVANQVIAGNLGGASAEERGALRRFRDASRATVPARERPADRRAAAGSVVVARCGRRPFTITNVNWASPFVDQRWMHADNLGGLVRRLAASPPDQPLVIAVAGRERFSPAHLAFSGQRRLALCFSDRTEHADTFRIRRLGALLREARPARRELRSFRGLCRARARTAEVGPIDRELMRYAARWGQDVHELHALLGRASDVELQALDAAGED